MPTLADQSPRSDAFTTWVSRMRGAIDDSLNRAIPAPPATPPVLDVALRYALLAGGKRVRPLLALAAADAVLGSEAESLRLAMPAACALELIHTYSLVHDDLPAMDDDDLRRGRPTTHIRFGEGQAILVGDGLLTEAFAWLAREPDDPQPAIVARKLRTIAVIATAAGPTGMVGGQAIDLDAARPHDGATRTTFDAATLADMHVRKTGALIEAAAVAGATMAGADPRTIAAVGAFGREIGLAFQIVDDVLDVEGTSADLGKTAGKDAAAGKPTYPSLFGLARSKALAAEARARARTALDGVGLGGHLASLADWVVERKA
jgi:geranylgeranyl diphosphate synthase, type II